MIHYLPNLINVWIIYLEKVLLFLTDQNNFLIFQAHRLVNNNNNQAKRGKV